DAGPIRKIGKFHFHRIDAAAADESERVDDARVVAQKTILILRIGGARKGEGAFDQTIVGRAVRGRDRDRDTDELDAVTRFQAVAQKVNRKAGKLTLFERARPSFRAAARNGADADVIGNPDHTARREFFVDPVPADGQDRGGGKDETDRDPDKHPARHYFAALEARSASCATRGPLIRRRGTRPAPALPAVPCRHPASWPRGRDREPCGTAGGPPRGNRRRPCGPAPPGLFAGGAGPRSCAPRPGPATGRR